MNLRVAIASAVMLVMFVKVMLSEPERQIELSQVQENFAGLEIGPFAAVSIGFIVIALSTLTVHFWVSRNKQIDNI